MGTGRILLVDDEKDFLVYMERVLGNAGFEVSSASNASEALAKAAEYRPDLVLLDVMLPDMSGWELCRKIKKKVKTRVLILTVPVGDDLDKNISNSGCSAFLEKPLTKKKLLEAVEKFTA